MTSLQKRKRRLVLETEAVMRYRGKNRAIVIEPGAFLCVVRLKGTRIRYEIPWEVIFIRSAHLAAELERSLKKAKKREMEEKL